MAFKKYFIGVLFVSLAVLALSNAKNMTIGRPESGERQLQFAHVKVPSKWLQIVKETKTFQGDGRSRITHVELIDNNKKGNGATPTIISGGPGAAFVTVEFKSKRGHSIDFFVNVYGK